MDALVDTAEEHEALLQFLYMAPVGLVQADMDGGIVMANPISAQLLMPLSRDGGLSNLFTLLQDVAPELRHLAADFPDATGMVCDGLRVHLGAGDRGRGQPQVLSLSLLRLDERRLMCVLNDITQQVRRERLLRQNEAWLNAVMTGISDYALARLDDRGRIGEWNASIGRVTGFRPEDVEGRDWTRFHPEGATTAEHVQDRLRDADSNGWSLDEGWRLRADGSRFWGSTMIVPLDERREPAAAGFEAAFDADAAGGYCMVVRDITDKREAMEQARQAMYTDHLTGVANRRALFDAAELEIARWRRMPRPLSLLLIDADHFKRVNDVHGHAAGDAVLRHLAGLLARSFRQVDVVARIGGEEFAVLLPSTDLAGAAGVAERLRRTVADSEVDLGGGVRLRCTISGGVATFEEGMAGLDALMRRADEALYAAKTAGRDRIVAGRRS